MITFAPNINETQKQGINALVQSGRAFNETDAKNYAYATGAKDFSQFVGKTGQQITLPQTFDASSLGTGTQFKSGETSTPADPTPYVQSLADATSQAQKDFQALMKSSAENAGVNKLETENVGLKGRLQDALSKLTGKSAALQTAEADLGVPQDLSRLKELNLQVTNLTNEYNKRIASIPGQGIGLTTGAVAQLTDREKRMAAVEIGGLAAVQSALQGNIALSQQQAERTVNMEYEPIEQEIKNLQTMLELNYDDLSRAEKKQADELNFVLQQRQAAVDQAKEDRLSIINMATEAAQQGADTVTLNKILKAGTIEDALAIAGDSLGAEFKAQQEQQKFENALALRDQALAESKATGGGGSGGGGGGVVVTTPTGQNVDLNAAIDFAVTNLTKDGRANAYATFNRFIKEGNTTAAAQYIDKLLLDKLPAGQKEEIGTMGTVSQLADQVLRFNQDGALEGVGGFGKGTFGQLADKLSGTSTEEARTVRVLVGNIKGTIAKLRGGTSFTDTEKKLLETYTPTINENAAVVVNKINNLKDYILKKQNDTLYSGLPVFTGSQNQTGGDVGSAKAKYGITY